MLYGDNWRPTKDIVLLVKLTPKWARLDTPFPDANISKLRCLPSSRKPSINRMIQLSSIRFRTHVFHPFIPNCFICSTAFCKSTSAGLGC